MDARLEQARVLHRAAHADMARAAEKRAQRDRLIRLVIADDPAMTQVRAAKAVGCSPELIAVIVRAGHGSGDL